MKTTTQSQNRHYPHLTVHPPQAHLPIQQRLKEKTKRKERENIKRNTQSFSTNFVNQQITTN